VEKIVFTDLDGTLLDFSTFSYEESSEAVDMLLRKNIPIVFCSAKTSAEQEEYRRLLRICDPFIVENGGAIFIPRGYFPFPIAPSKTIGDYLILEMGTPYAKVREMLKRVEQNTGCSIRGFGDMTAREIAKDSGLNLKFARLAKQREYDETFNIEGAEGRIGEVLREIEREGFSWTYGGKYYNAMGAGNDKGKATKLLAELFRRKLGKVEITGIGDSINDLPMLAEVDMPILVQKPGGSWEEMNLLNLHRIDGIGPRGWTRAVKKLIIKDSGNLVPRFD
jgi:mannosyl-3-phosphoglycerate phosphatase